MKGTPFTLNDLKNRPCAKLNEHLFAEPKKKRISKPSKEKEWFNFKLAEFARDNKLQLDTEYKFHPKRKWKFDWSFNDHLLAFEYEGIFSQKSRHTTPTGFTGDTEKYNAAQQLGWKVYRYTAINYLNLQFDLEAIKISIQKK